MSEPRAGKSDGRRCAVNTCRREATTVIVAGITRLVLCDKHANTWEGGVARPWAEAHDETYTREPLHGA